MLPNLPLHRATSRSKNAVLALFDSYVNWILWSKEIKPVIDFLRFSPSWIQIKKNWAILTILSVGIALLYLFSSASSITCSPISFGMLG